MAQSGIILGVQSVTVEFDGFKALDQLDFAMAYGELRFLIGPNGAGKTTLLDIITGKTRPSHGRIMFDGLPAIQHLPEHQRVPLAGLRNVLGLAGAEAALVDVDDVAIGAGLIARDVGEAIRKGEQVAP